MNKQTTRNTRVLAAAAALTAIIAVAVAVPALGAYGGRSSPHASGKQTVSAHWLAH